MSKIGLMTAMVAGMGASVSGAWGEKLAPTLKQVEKDRSNYAQKIYHLGRKKPKGSAAAQRREAKKRKALRARSKK